MRDTLPPSLCSPFSGTGDLTQLITRSSELPTSLTPRMMYLFTICINYNFLVKTVLMKTKNSHKRKSTKLEEAPNGFLDHVNNTYNSQFLQYSSGSREGSSAGPSCRQGSWWSACRKWCFRHHLASQACFAQSRRAGNWHKHFIQSCWKINWWWKLISIFHKLWSVLFGRMQWFKFALWTKISHGFWIRYHFKNCSNWHSNYFILSTVGIVNSTKFRRNLDKCHVCLLAYNNCINLWTTLKIKY